MDTENVKSKSQPYFLPDSDAFSALGQLKRAEKLDIPGIELLITENCHKIFGDISLSGMIDFSFLPLCQFDVSEKPIGFIVLDIFPKNPEAVQNDWIPWIHTMFEQYEVTARNTLFVHMICWDNKFNGIFLRHILESVFFSDPFLKFIIIVMPHNSPLSIHKNGTSMKNLLKRINHSGFCKYESLPFLNVAYRSRFCPKLKVRKAVEEDNDDLVALIHTKSTIFKELYGDFYISEIIGDRNATERVVLVAEFNSISVGVMILNTQINYQKLIQSFELEGFGNLLKRRKNEMDERQNNERFESVREANEVSNGKHASMMERNNDDFDGDSGSSGSKELEENAKSDSNTKSPNEVLNDDKCRHSGSRLEGYNEEIFSEKADVQSDCSSKQHYTNRFNQPRSIFETVEDSMSVKNRESLEEIHSESECFDESLNIDPFFNDATKTTIQKEYFDFSSERNAFMIEVFAMHEGLDERFGFDLLEASFRVFPELEYCLLSVPSHEKPFPLLEHFVFISPKPTNYFDHCLYVVHRNCIKSNLIVRHAHLSDLYQLKEFVKNLPHGERIMQQLKEKVYPDSVHHHAYVILTDEVIAGLALMREHDYSEKSILKNFSTCTNNPILNPISSSLLLVEEMVLAPQFQQNSRFFLREMMRISQFSDIYWLLYSQNALKLNEINFISTLSQFVPLLRRRAMEENPELFVKYKWPMKNTVRKMPTAVFNITRSICSFPNVDINLKLVIVGASNTAFSFLKGLLFGPSSVYLTFTSVTIVSKHGISLLPDKKTPACQMLASCGNNRFSLSDKCILQTCVNIVKTTMKAINRRSKYIVVDDGDRIHFDLLFLVCGKQYQNPNYHKEIGAPPSRMYGPDCIPLDILTYSPSLEYLATPPNPRNLFLVNDIVDACESLNTLSTLIRISPNSDVIVYGATIEAYCCVNALLQFGIPGSRISFVEPFPSPNPKEHQFTVFNNEHVDVQVRRSMLEQDIKIYRKYYFDSWNLDAEEEGTKITSVTFSSHFRTLVMDCVAMFYYGMNDIDKDTFMAIHKCGLVYNGGLIINGDYTTSDNCIYAAGPMTEYSKKYKGNDLRHANYLSEEIGFKFGEDILNNLNPFARQKETVTSKISKETLNRGTKTSIPELRSYSDMSLFSFDRSSGNKLMYPKCHESSGDLFHSKMPLVINCTLASGLNYLDIAAPGAAVPIELQALRHDYGTVMETFVNGYFRLHLDQKGYVASITCLTTNTLDVHNISCLWKKHELTLNKLVYRFEHGQISNFYDYFRQPWAYAIYHDRFDELMEKIDEEFCSKNAISNKDQLVQLENNDNLDSFTRHIEESIIKFLDKNNDILPMYANSIYSNTALNQKFSYE